MFFTLFTAIFNVLTFLLSEPYVQTVLLLFGVVVFGYYVYCRPGVQRFLVEANDSYEACVEYGKWFKKYQAHVRQEQRRQELLEEWLREPDGETEYFWDSVEDMDHFGQTSDQVGPDPENMLNVDYPEGNRLCEKQGTTNIVAQDENLPGCSSINRPLGNDLTDDILQMLRHRRPTDSDDD